VLVGGEKLDDVEHGTLNACYEALGYLRSRVELELLIEGQND
jgi:hypothetical protein